MQIKNIHRNIFKKLATPLLSRERGFTLLLAVIVSAISLSLGTAIFSIEQKEVTLSSVCRNSQFAFYAADTAAECALYWDMRFNFFSTSTPTVAATCDGQAVTVSGRSASYTPTSSMTFAVGFPAPCPALVSIRSSTGASPACACCKAAANLYECAGKTRSS